MIENAHVGMKVRLNSHGVRQIYGTTAGMGPLMKMTMKVTMIVNVNPDDYRETYIEVDNDEINQFVLSVEDFDPVDLPGEATIL